MSKPPFGIILAGGHSERFGGLEATPKPLVDIGGVPMVLQAAAGLARGGARKIIVLTGARHDDIRIGLGLTGDHGTLSTGDASDIAFELRYSGQNNGTAGRLLAVRREEFGTAALLAYTDVFADAPLDALLRLRERNSSALSMLVVNPRAPWGVAAIYDELVVGFEEKPLDGSTWINGGIFAVTAELLDQIASPEEMLEAEPMQRLIEAQKISALRHSGAWVSVDTPKDVRALQERPGPCLNLNSLPRIAPCP